MTGMLNPPIPDWANDGRYGYSITEVGRLVGRSRWWVINRINDGRITCIRAEGQRPVIPKWSLLEYLETPQR